MACVVDLRHPPQLPNVWMEKCSENLRSSELMPQQLAVSVIEAGGTVAASDTSLGRRVNDRRAQVGVKSRWHISTKFPPVFGDPDNL